MLDFCALENNDTCHS